ncbi:spermatogenesis-associated protein 20 [Podochytrium sp. JEL0797]|nr:spermatogenesis-associated protein 20 [Podochytrium sp. JEL0797]
MNRLKDEKSPYLLQHKDNPVDWYPWGPEAFKVSKDLNKPILLSVGYSTCHWCHVMAHESFESDKIAEVMNKYFVNVKVDREERPTVDRMYMAYVQALTGSGGWPMTVFLTPELKPFFGGTYFPPTSRHGATGFPDVVEYFGEKWANDSKVLTTASEEDFERLRQISSSYTTAAATPLDTVPPFSIPAKTFTILSKLFDGTYGGFGRAPKFPQPVLFNFLLTYYHEAKVPSEIINKLESEVQVSLFEMQRLSAKYGVSLDQVEAKDAQAVLMRGLKMRQKESDEALEMVEFTMRKIAAGGVHDHVGSGFHRYSVDKTWHVPHFEKMLYDQAQLLSVYADLAAITNDVFHEEVCRDIIKYVERDLKDPQGAFYSAEDADSLPTANSGHTKEGAFAVWESSEIDTHLGPDAALFKFHYGVNPGGNVHDQHDPHHELTNQNILHQRHTLSETATKFDSDVFTVKLTLRLCLEKLWAVRGGRPKPHRDDKIMVAWNGLMISALAKTSRQVQDDSKTILTLATTAAHFIKNNMYNPDTKTLTRIHGGNIPGYADDYAFLIDGLLELYQTTHSEDWLKWALDLQHTMDKLFLDDVNGGYFTGMKEDDGVLLRMKDEYDGAEPTPTSVAVKNLLRLDAILGSTNIDFKATAIKTLTANLDSLLKSPRSLPQMVVGWMGYSRGYKEIVVQGNLPAEMKHVLDTTFNPLATAVHLPVGKGSSEAWLTQQNPLLKSISESAGGEGGRVFICEGGSCNQPIETVEALKENTLMVSTKHLIFVLTSALVAVSPVSATWISDILHPHHVGGTVNPTVKNTQQKNMGIVETDSWNTPVGGGRKLVVAIDGTWQTPGSVADAPSMGGLKLTAAMTPSNIVKLAFLASNGQNQHDSDPATLSQMVYYHSGVASEVKDKKTSELEGNFGNIHKHLLDAYTWLAMEYREGDEIYAFGFSRGSTIVRSLFSFIRYAGLARRDSFDTHDDLMAEVNQAFDLYRSRHNDTAQHTAALVEFHQKHAHNHVLLKFMGVFDTVAALDVPEGYLPYVPSEYLTEIAESLGAIEPNNYHDLTIGDSVQHAYHAISIDEARQYFPPTLFEPVANLPANFTREQKWFRGAHADVGGGWWEQGLTDISLNWMIGKAREAGLEILDPSVFDKAFSPFLMGISREAYLARKKRIVHDYFADYPAGVSPNGKRVPRDLSVYMDAVKHFKSELHESVMELAKEFGIPETVKEVVAGFKRSEL